MDEKPDGKARSMMHQLLNSHGFHLLALLTAAAIIPVVYLFFYVFSAGLPSVSWEFLTQPPRDFLTAGGIFPALVGTVYLMIGTGIIAVPLGVATAIYLSEYASRGPLTRVIRLAIVNLAGVPSVVYGLFGLGLFSITLGLGRSLASGALTLGLLTLPIIIATSEEALNSVPDSYREASLALGASRWQTVRRVVLPQALPAAITGVILGLGRAAGETAPIMFTAAAFYRKNLPGSIFEQVMALPYHIYVVAAHAPNVPRSMAFAAAAVLLTLVFIFFAAAVGYRSWLRARGH